jgi:hypothetical protein
MKSLEERLNSPFKIESLLAKADMLRMYLFAKTGGVGELETKIADVAKELGVDTDSLKNAASLLLLRGEISEMRSGSGGTTVFEMGLSIWNEAFSCNTGYGGMAIV